MFEDRSISLMAYPVTTILAEKLETILSRGLATSRMRDFYDIKLLWDTQKDAVSIPLLRDALLATAEHRNTTDSIFNYSETIMYLSESDRLHEQWRVYQGKFAYAHQMTLEDACWTIRKIMDTLGIDSHNSEICNLEN